MKEEDELKREFNRYRSEANLRALFLDNAHRLHLIGLERLEHDAELSFLEQIRVSHNRLRTDLLRVARKHSVDLIEYDEEKPENE